MAEANLDAQLAVLPTASDNATAAAAAILVTPANKLATDEDGGAVLAAGAITSASFASGAITADAIATDALGALELAAGAAAEIADAVWDEAISGHAVAGSTGKALADVLEDTGTTLPAALVVVDANVDAIKVVTDSLDVSAVTQVAANDAGHLTITAALTFDEGVTGLTIPADWKTALWTLKADASKPDTAALVQLRETNPAALTDGIMRLNGAAVASPLTAASGALLVTQASGRIDIYLTDEATALLDDATGLGWDVKFIDAAGDSTGYSGTADVALTETKATA
jgi:hypothetical protein